MLGGCFDETPPAWSTLAPDSPPSKRSGLTSSDDAPRYRRGSKRKPLPPRTPPGLVQPLRRDLRVAFFPHGKHRGYAATSDIPPSTMLFQERPFTVAGAFSNARDALRETARRVAKDARYKHLSMGDDAGEHRNGDTQSGGRANAPSVDAPEPSPFQDEGIDDLTWNDSLKRVTRNARVRVAKKGEDVGGQSDSRSSPTGNDHGGTVSASPPARTQSTQNFVVTLFAHTTTCNHSCAPNAAVSASDDVATLYSLRAISKGEEVTVAYAADTLWLPFDLRRTRIARVFGFLCKCERCAAELENAARERDRGKGVKPQQALKHGVAKNGQTVFDSALNRRTLKNAGFRCWEYGETGFETQFDTEGRLLVETGGGVGEGGGTGSNPGAGGKGSWNSDTAGGTRDRRRETNDAASDSSDDSTSTSTLSDSSDDSDDDDLARGGTENGRQSASARYGSENTKGSQQKMTQKQKQTKVLGAHRLYNKLVSAGIGKGLSHSPHFSD